MVWLRFTRRNHLIVDLRREGNINQCILMDMTDLTRAKPKFRATKAVWYISTVCHVRRVAMICLAAPFKGISISLSWMHYRTSGKSCFLREINFPF